MIWLLVYLLTGFVLHFFATTILHIESDVDWRWELVATVFWPFTIISGIMLHGTKKREKQ